MNFLKQNWTKIGIGILILGALIFIKNGEEGVTVSLSNTQTQSSSIQTQISGKFLIQPHSGLSWSNANKQSTTTMFLNPALDEQYTTWLCSQNFLDTDVAWEELSDVLQRNPTTLSLEEFDSYGTLLLGAFSGSGGPFLCELHIQWLEKGMEHFREESKLVKDKESTFLGFASSYQYYRKYDKAIKYFEIIDNQLGIEEAVWFFNNLNKRYGDQLKIIEYPGEASCGIASIASEVEDENYKFIWCWKGPVLRFSKLQNTHTVIFAPVAEIAGNAGIAQLSWDKRYLNLFYGIFDNFTNKFLKNRE